MTDINRRRFLGSSAAAVGLATIAPGCGAENPPDGDAEQPSDDLSTIGKTPHTRFAVNVEMWWRNLPFPQRMINAAAFGFPAIEFWSWQGQDIDAIAELSQELNIEIAQFVAWFETPELTDPKNHEMRRLQPNRSPPCRRWGRRPPTRAPGPLSLLPCVRPCVAPGSILPPLGKGGARGHNQDPDRRRR